MGGEIVRRGAGSVRNYRKKRRRRTRRREREREDDDEHGTV
jgi:hypothetical protein